MSAETDKGKFPKNIVRELDACLQCGYCRDVCPVFEESPWESASPRGKVFMLKALSRKGLMDRILRLLGREVEITEDFVDRVFWCTSCGMCEVACHVEIPFPELWEEVKVWTVEMGLGPLPAHKRFLERIHDVYNPFGEDNSKRGDWAGKLTLSEEPDVIFYVGCTESFRIPRIALGTAVVLSKAKVKFNIMGGEEWCCTSPLLRTGQRSETRSFAEHTREQMVKWGAKTMITACAGCFATTRRDHAKELGPHPFELMHVSQYVERLLNDGRLKFDRPVERTVTYHDPCHLGRHGGVFEAPRNVIKAIPGIKFVEMPRNRRESRCCGAGAGFKAQHNAHALNIAVDRVREAHETGAEEIITTCPFCLVNLNAGADQAGIELKTRDLLQLIMEAIRPEEQPDGASGRGGTAVSPADR